MSTTETTDPITLDIREIPPPERHPRIHGLIDGLVPRQTLTLINDHRPSPLRYELNALRPGEIEWVDGETGPEVWTVTITKLVKVLDVRPVIDAGDEPFDTIMAEVAEIGDDDLVVVAPFEPAPLEGVLSSQGFSFEANEVEPGHWRTRFHREG